MERTKARTISYTIWKEGSKTKYTTLENAKSHITDANKILTFDGTVENCKKWIIENLEKGWWDD